MKILIIGAKGFIGSNAITYFTKVGYNVFSCDIVPDESMKQYFTIDATVQDFTHLFSNNDFDFCINCSGAASVGNSYSDVFNDFNLNTVNVFKLLAAIKTYRPTCKFLNLSSAAVYGNPSTLPIREDSALKPLSPYGYHKLMAEIACTEYADLWGVNTSSARIFSAYGPGLRKQFFWDLYHKILANEHVELFGTGEESRDFIFVDDLLQGLHMILLNAPFKGEAINLGNGKEIFIKDVVDLFLPLFKKEIDIKFNGQVREGDPQNWCADTSTLAQLGYSQKYSFQDGIIKTFNWLKESNDAK